MKTGIRSRVFSFIAAVLFTVACLTVPIDHKAYASSAVPEILITEVMPMSQSGDDIYEYIELYNNSDYSMNLKDYKLPLQNVDYIMSRVIPSKGILVMCTRSNTTLASFNTFYGTSLTDDKYTTLPSLHEILDNTSAESIIIARDNNIVIVGAGYSEGDIEAKKSINFKYPMSGFEMNKMGVKQGPTPGNLGLTQVPDSGVRVTGVMLDKEIITMEVHQTAVLYATVVPATTFNKSVLWASDDTDIVEVDQKGMLTAKKDGDAVITVKAVDGGFTASCEVIVGKVPATGVTLDRTRITLDAGQAVFLVATVTPKNATNKGVTWGSSNSTVAAVNENGMVTGKSKGTAVISVKTTDGNHIASCIVEVNNDVNNLRVTGVSLDKTAVTLETGKAIVLEARIRPTNAANKNVVWSSSKTDIASVDKNGVVTALKDGRSLITVSTIDGGYTAFCLVTVTDKAGDNEEATGFRLNKELVSLKMGKSQRIVPIFSPSGAKGLKIEWDSNDKNVAVVSEGGWVTGLKGGYTEITATASTKDGKYSDTCVVYVRRHDNGKSKWNDNEKIKGQGNR